MNKVTETEFETILSKLYDLDIHQLQTIETVVSDLIKDENGDRVDEHFFGEARDRLLKPLEASCDEDPDDYDQDRDPNAVFIFVTKEMLDIELLEYRLRDPRLSWSEKKTLMEELGRVHVRMANSIASDVY